MSRHSQAMHARLAVAAAAVSLVACSPRVTTIGTNDAGTQRATATLSGQVCTPVPDPTAFAVKLVILLDQSGSNCITDPPGSQGTPGFCEQYSMPPSGVTQPARIRALNRLLDSIDQRADIGLALVPFSTNVAGVWPGGFGPRFAHLDVTLRTRIASLQSELGKAGDTQGALELAHALIAADINDLEALSPETLPLTKYVVVMVTDGPPSPRCAGNDNLSIYATAANPVGVWADTDGNFCNLIDPQDPDAITGFLAGSDRNQDGQLVNLIDQLNALEAQHHVGGIRFNTVLLENVDAVTACGPACQDLFGFNRTPAGAYAEARAIYSLLATRGGGSFTEFANAAGLDAFAQSGFNGIDLGSLAAVDLQRALIPQLGRAVAWEGAWQVDQDGDGLPNAVELAHGLDPLDADTDGDGFEDRFEFMNAAQGFDPLLRDGRGCDPMSPLTPQCLARDTDGDGLSQFAENFFGTHATLVDDDRDGIPDGLEVRLGLDPTSRLDPATDTDGDGISDFDEVLQATDPFFPDAHLAGITVTSTLRPQTDGSNCYDYVVSNLPMLDVPFEADGPVPPGVNLFKLWFASAPDLVPEAVGTWRATCSFTRLDSTQSTPIVVPANLAVTLFDTDFRSTFSLTGPGSEALCAHQEALTP